MKKQKLIKEQNNLMKERAIHEYIQTEYSKDTEFYKHCQRNMDRLDDKADQIRVMLEMRCCD